eukprot:CAMPEP_0184328098 /NCGR_PEP_ID=MMETSP1049-20130417/143441_1 /TAXON_ID=77928 /ORGANISM="Proteomonas sulcata, Strain CCMP704" /LENGTH=110 /DNA_ID=CAMNT_0026650387 /DNA_START=487 /DNA_END=819 /DNA_ORIENTATION=+
MDVALPLTVKHDSIDYQIAFEHSQVPGLCETPADHLRPRHLWDNANQSNSSRDWEMLALSIAFFKASSSTTSSVSSSSSSSGTEPSTGFPEESTRYPMRHFSIMKSMFTH